MSTPMGAFRRLEPVTDIIEFLFTAAATAATDAARNRRLKQRRLRRRGNALQPGADTPLWNELVRRVRPHLRRRGTKAQLARELDLPRQRLQDCLNARTAMLDGERTLLLLAWLAAKERGTTLATPPQGVL